MVLANIQDKHKNIYEKISTEVAWQKCSVIIYLPLTCHKLYIFIYEAFISQHVRNACNVENTRKNKIGLL
jgi:hypothetical protein